MNRTRVKSSVSNVIPGVEAVMRIMFAIVTILLAPGMPYAFAQEADGAKVYKQVVPSTVWIHSKRSNGLVTGSGSFIDRERRLILTNYHVVGDESRVRVFFPVFRNGQPIAEKDYYLDRLDKLSIPGRVIVRDKSADLSLIQIDRVPRDVPVLPLAQKSAEPGQSVHSIGSAGRSDALWGYVEGKVRAVHRKSWRAKLEPGKTITFTARVVETNSATNPGDSGGPLVNSTGELVAVTQGAAVDAQLLSYFIDVSEVRDLLKSREVQALRPERATAKSTPTASARTEPLKISDRAKLFSVEAVEMSQKDINQLFQKHHFDYLIETYASVPEADIEKVKSMNAKDRTDYIREWAIRRMKAENVQGVVILICSNPRSLWVELSRDQQKQFSEEFAKGLVEKVITGLKSDKQDGALTEPLKAIRDHLEAKK